MNAFFTRILFYFEAGLKHLKSSFSEPDGSGSASRFLAALVILATIGWITAFLIIHKDLPDFSGPTLFLGSGTSATYGINQAKATIAAFKGAPLNGNPPPPGS